MKTNWTKAEIEDFREWHEKRLFECEYPEVVCRELRKAREKWLPVEKNQVDPFYDNIVLLLHCEVAPGATSFT